MERSEKDLFATARPDFLVVACPFTWLWRWASFRLLGWSWKPELLAESILDNVSFGEGPRIHENHLYFSDMHENEIIKVNIDTKKIVKKISFQDKVSGIGFLPDGRMLVVSMTKQQLLVVTDDTRIEVYADLSQYSRYRCNDMVVDSNGRAYVGNFGFDFRNVFQTNTTTVVQVNPDQSVEVAATDMFFPNGSVITPDGKTLIIGETFRGMLTAFDIDSTDGSLSNRRIWADLGAPCDGMCLDADGCIWVAIPQIGIYKTSGCIIRVKEGGEVLECYGFNQNGLQSSSIACNLATNSHGEHCLFICEAETSHDDIIQRTKRANGRLKMLKVKVGPAKRASCTNYNAGYC